MNTWVGSTPRFLRIRTATHNQGVCGRGVLQFQRAKIEVELFPHDLAQRIERLNEAFIRAQQGFGVRIHDPRPSGAVELERGEPLTLRGELINPPSAADLIIVMSRVGNEWYICDRIATSPHSRGWSASIYPLDGKQTLVVVRATEAGRVLIDHAQRVNAAWGPVAKALSQRPTPQEPIRPIPVSISMAVLPKGLDVEDSVDVEIRLRPT